MGNLGVEVDHPPKMCAGLAEGTLFSEHGRMEESAVALTCRTSTVVAFSKIEVISRRVRQSSALPSRKDLALLVLAPA